MVGQDGKRVVLYVSVQLIHYIFNLYVFLSNQNRHYSTEKIKKMQFFGHLAGVKR